MPGNLASVRRRPISQQKEQFPIDGLDQFGLVLISFIGQISEDGCQVRLHFELGHLHFFRVPESVAR
jgi:hypothetical protein